MLISQERDGTDAYYIYDGHGSVRMLADENSEVIDRYDYDAYGVLTGTTGTTVNPYLYAGEQYDQTTRLYYLRARYMDPSGGRFVSMDRYAGSIFDPVSLHKYLYGNANPVMYRDPTGYFSMSDMMGSLGILGVLNGIPTSNLLAGLGILFSGVLLTQVVITPRDMMEGYFVNPFPGNVGQDILNGNTAIWEVFENSSLNTAGQLLGRVLEVFGSDTDSQAVFEVRGEGVSGPDDSIKTGDKTPDGRSFSKHGAERANERGFSKEVVDSIINNNKKKRKSKVDGQGRKTWEYTDARGNKVVTNESGGIVSVHSPAPGGKYIPKK